MSKLIYIYYKKPSSILIENNRTLLRRISKRILPDNIIPNPMRVMVSKNSIIGIFNPVSTLLIEDGAVCMGYTSDKNWNVLREIEQPEGSYAIFREDINNLEILSDIVGSRTVWYYHDESIFIASTSQRAIVIALGSFNVNSAVIPWMLSSGTLGPNQSYDVRLKILHNNSILTLDKVTFEVSINRKEIELHDNYKSHNKAKEDLKNTLRKNFDQIDFDYSKWILPLSGGYDSRGILYLLKTKDGLKTITWGTKESLFCKENDAYIAKALADKNNLPHTYFESNSSEESINRILNRFLICGEGRIDHIGGYMDGMQIWKKIFEKEWEGIIRGDEIVGLGIVKSDFGVRLHEGLLMLSDYINCKNIQEKFGLAVQQLPNEYQHLKNENRFQWKGRLSFTYENPIIFAALSDIKLCYVEIANPLLSRTVVEQICRIFSEKWIGDKKLFKELVDEWCPNVPIAKQGANMPFSDICNSKKFKEEVIACLESVNESDIIPKKLALFALSKLQDEAILKRKIVKKDIIGKIKKIMPQWLMQYISAKVQYRVMDMGVFAFRVYLLVKMGRIMNEDATIGEQLKNDFAYNN